MAIPRRAKSVITLAIKSTADAALLSVYRYAAPKLELVSMAVNW